MTKKAVESIVDSLLPLHVESFQIFKTIALYLARQRKLQGPSNETTFIRGVKDFTERTVGANDERLVQQLLALGGNREI